MIYPLDIAMKDPRMKRIFEDLEKAGKSQRWLAGQLSVSGTAVRHWFKTGNPPRNEALINQALAIIGQEIEKLSTFHTQSVPVDTGVYYNSDTDSALADVFTTRHIDAYVIGPSLQWSAKSMMRRISVSGFPGRVTHAVQITERWGDIKAGSVLFFRDSIYPTEGVILLLEARSDAKQYCLGWIDPEISGIDFQSPSGPLLPSEWSLMGYCFAVGWGPGDQVNDGRWSASGIPVP